MEGDDGLTNETLFREECSIPLEVLDFIQNFNQSDLELIWPCQVRYYWLNLQSFVKVVRILLAYVTPFVIVLGVILNIISFGMLSKSVSDSGLSLYLRALAISDNGALIFDYGVGVARSNFSAFNTLFMNSKFLCCMNSVCMEFFQITSTWLVVSLTWARVAAIIFPLQTLNKNHDRSAVIVIITLTCISLAVSLTKLYCGGYESDSVFEYVTCQKIVIPWGIPMYFYIAFCTWLPLLFVFIGNVLLIFHMRKSEAIHTQLTGTVRNKLNFINRTSGTLLAVSIVHLILLLPIGFVETLELYWDVILKKHPSKDIGENQQQYISWLQEKMLLKWCRGLFFHIYHWNFAINFFLYYLTGKKFRDRVINALKNCTKFSFNKHNSVER